jgi:hypothetical protein
LNDLVWHAAFRIRVREFSSPRKRIWEQLKTVQQHQGCRRRAKEVVGFDLIEAKELDDCGIGQAVTMAAPTVKIDPF